MLPTERRGWGMRWSDWAWAVARCLYGLVFIGWGVAFFVPQLAGYLYDATGSFAGAFYLSGGLLMLAVLVSRAIGRPGGA